MSVAVRSRLQNLVREFLNCFWWQWATNLPHILFEIVFAVLKDQVQVILLIDHLLQFDYIRMFDAFQKGDLADGRTWHTVVLLLQFDFLKCYDLTSLGIFGLVHNTISTLSKFV